MHKGGRSRRYVALMAIAAKTDVFWNVTQWNMAAQRKCCVGL